MLSEIQLLHSGDKICRVKKADTHFNKEKIEIVTQNTFKELTNVRSGQDEECYLDNV